MRIELDIHRRSKVLHTPRVMQLEGMFDVPPSESSDQAWTHRLDLPEPWSVGVVVGPSGAGKSTFAREAFGAQLVEAWPWPADQSLLDGFPAAMGIKDITGLLSSVGFSSPPAWVRPFAVLSNGEQFRVNLARTLAELPDLAVVDEFTSVVDRQVAKVGSAAVAKTVRRRKQRFVAVTCHYDVIDWLEPDWVYEPHTGDLEVADATRGSVRRRPPINIEVARVHSSAWRVFKPHHYLTAALNPSAVCFVALVDGTPVAFDAWLPFFGRLKDHRKARRGHRTVCLPDYQGVGIGAALFNHNASLWAGLGYRAFSCTGHPAEIRSRVRSGLWRMTSGPGFPSKDNTRRANASSRAAAFAAARASCRLTARFEYIGPAMEKERALSCLNG